MNPTTEPAEDVQSTPKGGHRDASSERTPLLAIYDQSQSTQWKVHARDRSARARLQPYIDKAISRQKYQYRLGKLIKWGINFILLLQVSVGAFVTIVSVLEPNESTRLATAVLGAVGTFTAAVLARAKGTNQPELAETHARELEKFIGQCQLFVGDVGSAVGPEIDTQVVKFVRQFDAIEDNAVQSARGREARPIGPATV